MKKWILSLLVCFLFVLPVSAEGEIPITSAADLAAIGNNPRGTYILMNDVDMTGVDWSCPDFSGVLNGNGHAIMNLTLTRTGSSLGTVRDGNLVEYQAVFAGLFGRLERAEIKNLKLLNLRGVISCDTPCFVGSIAGFTSRSVVENCEIVSTLELRAHDECFGMGGVYGYGSGFVRNSKVDTTLICADTDVETKDEQFLGGVFATGFVGVKETEINIDGYISEHGYVHSGGISGMFMEYPLGEEGLFVNVDNNTVSGKISFFEDNGDRRAYCEAVIGETNDRSWAYSALNNETSGFVRDEHLEHDKELRPEMCESPDYVENVVSATCSGYGYTKYACRGCGYTYTDHYTSGEHNVTAWETKVAPTTTETGISVGTCSVCGANVELVLDVLPEAAQPTVPATEAAPVAETMPVTEAAPVEETAPIAENTVETEAPTVPETTAAPATEATAAPQGETNPTNLTLPEFDLMYVALGFAILILIVTLVLFFAVLIRALRRKH